MYKRQRLAYGIVQATIPKLERIIGYRPVIAKFYTFDKVLEYAMFLRLAKSNFMERMQQNFLILFIPILSARWRLEESGTG